MLTAIIHFTLIVEYFFFILFSDIVYSVNLFSITDKLTHHLYPQNRPLITNFNFANVIPLKQMLFNIIWTNILEYFIKNHAYQSLQCFLYITKSRTVRLPMLYYLKKFHRNCSITWKKFHRNCFDVALFPKFYLYLNTCHQWWIVKFLEAAHPEVFLGKSVLKICSRFTGEHPCRFQ